MIYIGADHAGYQLKEQIKEFLSELRIEYQDIGANAIEPKDDFPDYAKRVAEKVNDSENQGILVCGTGMGMCIGANRYKGVRAVLAWSPENAKAAREDNDANILCLGGRTMNIEMVKPIIKTWFETPFSKEERHLRRIKKLSDNGSQ